MKYMTHNEKRNINAGGTSLCDYVTASYADLVRIFGAPTTGDCYKTDAEWIIEFEDGVVATIYNYKDGRNYCGEEGLDVEFITNWHIGGHQREGVPERIKDILTTGNARTPKQLKFSKIERISDYHDEFVLDGRKLEYGSKIVLLWPSGNMEKTEVKLETVGIRDGEGHISYYSSRLSVPAEVHGLNTLVDLTLDAHRNAVLAAWSDEET